VLVGLDLDNTLIDYDAAFCSTAMEIGLLTDVQVARMDVNGPPSKTQVKSFLLSQPDGDRFWEALQGQVYGSYIHKARLFPGVLNFLKRCHAHGISVVVLSHKTQYGHYDESGISLREAAIGFLDENGFFGPGTGMTEQDVLFFDTREDKVAMIGLQRCDSFIDDLPAVFDAEHFPSGTEKILFNGVASCATVADTDLVVFDNWNDIASHLLGDVGSAELKSILERSLNQPVGEIEQINGRGNSRVFSVRMVSGMRYVAKLYPEDRRGLLSRLGREQAALDFMNSNGIDVVPKLIFSDVLMNIGLYEWIDGAAVHQVSDDDLCEVISFIGTLSSIGRKAPFDHFPMASAACVSGQMIEEQLWERFLRISGCNLEDACLQSYLQEDMKPLIDERLAEARDCWPSLFFEPLIPDHQLLSPSDFGFHNALRTKDGIRFIDFEYFGWDDPVKLTSDFLLHPGMTLTDEQKQAWVDGMADLCKSDESFSARLQLAYPLYALIWCLIFLNEYCPEGMHRRRRAHKGTVDVSARQAVQLEKSKKMLEHVSAMKTQGFFYE